MSGGSTERRGAFDLAALYEAIEERRRARGLTLRQVGAEVGVSVATIKRAAEGGRMEADGVLAMVQWLDRTPEDFLRSRAPAGPGAAPSATGALRSDDGQRRYARVDSTGLCRALDAERARRGLTWEDVARELGAAAVAAATLRRLSKPASPGDRGRQGLGPRIGIHLFVAAASWLGREASDFMRTAGAQEGSGK